MNAAADVQAARRRRRDDIARAVRAQLAERFPGAFRPRGPVKTPLAIGIYAEIRTACPDISARHLNVALRDYTSGASYLQSLVAGVARVALDGTPAGTVTPEEAADARRRIDKLDRRLNRRAAAPAPPHDAGQPESP